MSSSEQLIRQYVRESLIAERKGRESVLRRGTGPGVSTAGIDALNILKQAKKVITHFANAIGAAIHTGTALFKGAESVFKVGAEGIKGVFTDHKPDYDSIITGQAAALRKSREFFGIDKIPTLGQSMGFTKGSSIRESDVISLCDMNMSFLIEDYKSETEIVDDAVRAAAEEIEEEPEIVEPEIIEPELEEPEIVEPLLPEEDPELAPPPGSELETELQPEPAFDPSSSVEVASHMAAATQSDIDRIMSQYRDIMASNSLEKAVREISILMGKPGSEIGYTPQGLAQSVMAITGEEPTVEEIESGSQEILGNVKRFFPGIFRGILKGAKGHALTLAADLPPDSLEAVTGAISPIYDSALGQIKLGTKEDELGL